MSQTQPLARTRTGKRSTSRVFPILLLVVTSPLAVGAQTSQAQFDQLVERLRASPTDKDLREQLIKTAAEMKPSPAIPEAARRAFVQGNAIAKEAKDPDGQKLAVQSFQEALKIAPWWGDAYYNLAIEQELLGSFPDAKDALRWYVKTKPGEKEERAAQDKIYAIEAKEKLAQDAAAKEQARQAQIKADADARAAAEARKRQLAASIQWMQGGWYAKNCHRPNDDWGGCSDTDRAGKNWYVMTGVPGMGFPIGPQGQIQFSFEFKSDGTVKMNSYVSWAGCKDGDVIGTPYGTDHLELNWEFVPNNGGPKRNLWYTVARDQTRITISCDRPFSDSDANPSRQYHYMVWYRP